MIFFWGGGLGKSDDLTSLLDSFLQRRKGKEGWRYMTFLVLETGWLDKHHFH